MLSKASQGYKNRNFRNTHSRHAAPLPPPVRAPILVLHWRGYVPCRHRRQTKGRKIPNFCLVRLCFFSPIFHELQITSYLCILCLIEESHHALFFSFAPLQVFGRDSAWCSACSNMFCLSPTTRLSLVIAISTCFFIGEISGEWFWSLCWSIS